MGFTSVFMALLEVFPQVDPRILRAVAIENSNDADVAVGVVLAEVMPSLSIQSGIGSGGSSSDQGLSLLSPYGDVQASDIAGGNDGVSEETVIDEQIPSTKPVESSRVKFGNFVLNSIVSGPKTAANESHTQVYENGFGKDVSLPERHNTEAGPKDISRAMVDEFSNKILYDTDGSVNSSFLDEEEQSNLDELVRKNHRSVSQVVDVDPSSVRIISVNVPEGSSKLLTVPVSPVTQVGEPEAGVPSLVVSGEDVTSSKMVDCENAEIDNIVSDISIKEPNGVKDLFSSEVNDFEDEPSMKATVTSRSGQMCTTELLEDIIENEKSEKTALRSARDSLFCLTNEVQMKEKYVQKAREEAAQGGLDSDTLARVEDLTKMLQRAKEANDMYAGEVYGEKAILASEMRELQSRLRSLSEERVKALAIINEIHKALEVRLVSAEEEIKEAESEKLKKEESVLKYLDQEESNMEKLVQESKILEQQAEENSKLREFLTDRGQLVDILQGEISVICQDVEFVKSKFEQGVPFSKSLSSSQTTSISTFSSSSVVGASFKKVPDVVASPEDEKESLLDSDDDQVSNDEVPSTGKEIVDDDDWNLLDAHEYGI